MSGLLRMQILLGVCLACALASPAARAQDTTTTSHQYGQPTVTTDVQSAVVVYVSGNYLVVKMDDGQVKDFTVPDSTTVEVNGQQLNVHQLQPGMRLTRTITTTSTPKTVTTVRTIKGRVWHVNPPKTVILTLPDGTNKQYEVPPGQTFTYDGGTHDIFALRKGTLITATVVTESPVVVQSSSTAVTGTMPPPPATPPAPAQTAILIAIPVSRPAPAETQPQPEVARELPKTGSPMPLFGLLGLVFLGTALGLRALSRSWPT